MCLARGKTVVLLLRGADGFSNAVSHKSFFSF
jgi:hypothetical protein